MEPVSRQELDTVIARQDQADADRREMRGDIKQIRHDTREVVEMFRAISGGVKVLAWLGKGAVIFTAFAGAFTVIKGWFK